GGDRIGDRRAVFLRETIQEVAPLAHAIETRRIEIDVRRVVRQLARGGLDRVEAGVKSFLQSRERGIETLELLELPRGLRETREHAGFFVLENSSERRGRLANLGRILETPSLFLELHVLPVDELGVLDLAGYMSQIVGAALGL